MLFLGVTNYGLTHLTVAAKEFLACEKISKEYDSQLQPDQKEDLRKRTDEESKKVESALVNAYSTVLKYSVKNDLQTLSIKQFKESLDRQINENIIDALKSEEWLLDSVGLGTLRKNNLLPTLERTVKVKDVYEAFIRFDDKPMITSPEAVQKILLKYCAEGAFCIAFGDEKEFTKFYLKENVPFLDVGDANYWLVEKTLKPTPEPNTTDNPVSNPEPSLTSEGNSQTENPVDAIDTVKSFQSITVSGKVALEHFHELFGCFIAPFAPNGNRVEIQVSFKIASVENNPLTESKQQYKSAKEAAKQLGLNFEEEKV